MRLSESQRNWLKASTAKYHAALPGSPAEEHLRERGLDPDEISRFRIGFVGEPEPGHEKYRGRIAIPYLRRSIQGGWTVVTIRFRTLDPENKRTKYLDLSGELGKPRLYNTVDAIDHQQFVSITEGEFDALSASVNGVPAVGVSGATKWRPHWTEVFSGYETVYVLSDGDEAGQNFADLVAKNLNNARNIPMDDGEDVNSMIQKYGVDKIKERMGL